MATKKSSKKQTTSSTEKRPAKRKKIVSLAQYEAEAKAEKAQKQAAPAAPTNGEVTLGSKKAAKASNPTTEATGGDKAKRGGKLSGLDAAVQILREASKPLNTSDMVKQMLEQGLWKTSGKTPASTIYAAIVREIATKGDKARFRKTERGKFELAK